jgi:hypothetical protein
MVRLGHLGVLIGVNRREKRNAYQLSYPKKRLYSRMVTQVIFSKGRIIGLQEWRQNNYATMHGGPSRIKNSTSDEFFSLRRWTLRVCALVELGEFTWWEPDG